MSRLFDENRVYTINEISDPLRVSPVTLTRAIHRGRLRALRVGGQWRIPGREILRYLYLETKASLAKRQSRASHHPLRARRRPG